VLLEPDPADLLEPDPVVRVDLPAAVPVDRLWQAVRAEARVDLLEPDLVVRVDPAAVAARTPSSIPRMAKFPTLRTPARSLTT
jgi:hypothetical protein